MCHAEGRHILIISPRWQLEFTYARGLLKKPFFSVYIRVIRGQRFLTLTIPKASGFNQRLSVLSASNFENIRGLEKSVQNKRALRKRNFQNSVNTHAKGLLS
jgi:hypothetical protein